MSSQQEAVDLVITCGHVDQYFKEKDKIKKGKIIKHRFETMKTEIFSTISSLFDGASKEDDEILVEAGLIEVLVDILKKSNDKEWILEENNRFLPFQVLNYLESLINAKTEWQQKIYKLKGIQEIISLLTPLDIPGRTWMESYAALSIINTRVEIF
jgi:hypothetical protein